MKTRGASQRMKDTYILGVTLQTARHELAERLGERPLERRWWVLWNQEEHLHETSQNRSDTTHT